MTTVEDAGDPPGRFDAVLSTAPIGATLLNSKGQFVSANQAFLDLVGAPPTIDPRSQTVCSCGIYQSEHVREYIQDLKSGVTKEINFDAQWTSKWAKQVDAQVYVAKVIGVNDEVFYQVFYEDRSCAPTERDSKLYKSMLDTSTNEFHVIDRESQKYLFVNQRAIKELGYSMSEFQSMTPADICSTSTPNDIRENFLKPLVDGATDRVTRVGHFRRKDGQTYLVNLVIQDTVFDGKPAYLIIAQDISDAIATHAALKQAELFLSSAPDPTVLVDNAGKIAFASSQTENLLGFERSELVGMSIDQFWPDSITQLKPMRIGVNPCATDSQPGDSVEHFIHRDGSTIPVETTLSRIETSDAILVAIACRNVSKRLATEKALKAAKEAAEHATVTKSHLLAAASHDLRQPIQSLSHYSWLTRQAATTPEQTYLASNIQASVDSIANLLNAFLDISKLDSGATQPNIVEYDIQSLCSPILSNFGPEARAAGIELTCNVQPFFVRGDPVLVQRIIENLVSNAIRYTRKGSVRINSDITQDGFGISVSDTGIGIDNSQIERIFDDHYQIASVNSADTKGLGLGLSIVQRISKLLSLPVAVSSELGKGSRFTITLEAVGVKPSVPARVHRIEGGKDSIRAPEVLLIDDEPAVLTSTRMVLERHHCTVHTADTAEDAMQQLQSGIRPDVLVTDYRLPGNSGTQLVESAREALGHNIPAVIITGDMSGDAIKIEHLPAIEVLHKPTNLKRLVGTIVQLANQHTLKHNPVVEGTTRL